MDFPAGYSAGEVHFGTHGDVNMTGPKPADGPEGLLAYDSDAYHLLYDFYSGNTEVAQLAQPRKAPVNIHLYSPPSPLSHYYHGTGQMGVHIRSRESFSVRLA